MWNDQWQPIADTASRGGQGYVLKVVRKADGVIGALKLLHPDHLENIERRFRMQQEANALLAMDGQRVPRILDTNADQWRDKGVALYIVMEWIDGRTLAQHVNGRPQPLDTALVITRSLLDSVTRCHELSIFHRDLKPDNIILRDEANPVLVDFGMSWTSADDGRVREFETEVGQEIGNRFLRLPEHVPGRHLHDQRSDITMVIGLLFYMLTGQAPRALRNVRGAMPHEVAKDRFAPETTQDARWPRLQRIFNVGFQENIELRFASARDVLDRLDDLVPAADIDVGAELRRELERMQDLLGSARARELTRLRAVLSEASKRYLAAHMKPLVGSGFNSGGSGPNLVDGGRASALQFFIVQENSSEPTAGFQHRVELVDQDLVASVAIERENLEVYYRGLASDPDGLFEAVEHRAPLVLAQLFRTMHSKLEPHY